MLLLILYILILLQFLLLYLNTSNVTVNQMILKVTLLEILDLNTSNVTVNHLIARSFKHGNCI